MNLELINKGYITEEDIQIFYYDRLFENLLIEGNSYNDLMRIIHYIIVRLSKKDFLDEEGNLITNKYGYLKEVIYNNITKLNCVCKDDLWIDNHVSNVNEVIEF